MVRLTSRCPLWSLLSACTLSLFRFSLIALLARPSTARATALSTARCCSARATGACRVTSTTSPICCCARPSRCRAASSRCCPTFTLRTCACISFVLVVALSCVFLHPRCVVPSWRPFSSLYAFKRTNQTMLRCMPFSFLICHTFVLNLAIKSSDCLNHSVSTLSSASTLSHTRTPALSRAQAGAAAAPFDSRRPQVPRQVRQALGRLLPARAVRARPGHLLESTAALL